MLQVSFSFLSAARATLSRVIVKEADAPLAGVSFLEQEPHLAKESGLYTRENSGWAMGGHPVLD